MTLITSYSFEGTLYYLEFYGHMYKEGLVWSCKEVIFESVRDVSHEDFEKELDFKRLSIHIREALELFASEYLIDHYMDEVEGL